MMMVIAVALIVSGALIAGGLWGTYASPSQKVSGFLISLAGGALILSLMKELIEPATQQTSVLLVCISIFAGAAIFTGLDYLVDEKWSNSSGIGLLIAITLDGIPENLALGVALISTEPTQVVALAGSILLSNLPESAAGAKLMSESGYSKKIVLSIWTLAALLLSAATVLGNLTLKDAPGDVLGMIQGFAAGAVVASLATELFPKAYQSDKQLTGIATALGLIAVLLVDRLA